MQKHATRTARSAADRYKYVRGARIHQPQRVRVARALAVNLADAISVLCVYVGARCAHPNSNVIGLALIVLRNKSMIGIRSVACP